VIEAIAMSLYMYNVSSGERAHKLYQHFDGACAEPPELQRWVDSPYWATEMPLPTARVYLDHAVMRYGEEARRRAGVL
jgi:hypothetical protein